MTSPLPKWLRRIGLFENCTVPELEEISKLFRPKMSTRKEILFHEGQPCEVIYFLSKGNVKVYKSTMDGRDQIVNVLNEGSIFPHVGIFGESDYPGTAETLDDCELYLIYVKELTQLLSKNPGITIKLLQEMDRRIRDLQNRLTYVLSRDVVDKVWNILITLTKDHGEPTQEGYKLNIEITHQDIANMAGLTRETVSRVISQLKKEGRLVLKQKAFLLKK